MNMIKPTIGRVVWFQPSKAADQPLRTQPYPALVCYVHSDSCINVAYFNEGGTACSATSVTLVQDEKDREGLFAGYFAEWMPYQVGQAKVQESKVIGSNKDMSQLRAQAIDMALRSPGIKSFNEVLTAAAAYQAHIEDIAQSAREPA
jgi:hypothetical protein